MIIRKVATNRVYLSDHECYTNHIVELSDHIIIRHYPLTTELPHTEWLGGTIVIRNQYAYHTNKVLSSEEVKTIDITDMIQL